MTDSLSEPKINAAAWEGRRGKGDAADVGTAFGAEAPPMAAAVGGPPDGSAAPTEIIAALISSKSSW
eukprot:CAMPEP_0183294128 /NCGR_PEP_ID=MMETSP0160_2-20130417/2577_1 /TAXON_ID=2839 ORGANISM="Odontella Sinensis, Strain Grunow 1884" /NCGR_SAMPLE_ID=MMETSP0160_2 /ASSEMBLY_ACC=CAM_ASM_000250 /LENGTH=66 /DNA_ID=CAMNT_0025455381 /DNA_START=689 /DNA_END=889 /DNA_ORIENTATION=-